MCFSSIFATCRARKVPTQILSTAEGDEMANYGHLASSTFSMSPIGVNSPVISDCVARCVQASLGFVAGCGRYARIPPFPSAVGPDIRRWSPCFIHRLRNRIHLLGKCFGEHVTIAAGGTEAQLVVKAIESLVHSNEIRMVRCLPELQEKARSTVPGTSVYGLFPHISRS